MTKFADLIFTVEVQSQLKKVCGFIFIGKGVKFFLPTANCQLPTN